MCLCFAFHTVDLYSQNSSVLNLAFLIFYCMIHTLYSLKGLVRVLYSRPVYYYEMDQMGIVHHANYIHYFEEARLEGMRQLGLGYEQLIEMGLASPVMQLSCEYMHPSRYPDTLEINLLLNEYDGVRFRFAYEVRRQSDQQLLARGETLHCLISSSGIPVRIWTRFPEIHQLMLRWLEESQTEN